MAITLTTSELIDEVGVAPAAVANAGSIYTFDVAGDTELFYRNSAGVISQITPATPSVPSGWTDDGLVVRLTTSTDQVGIGTAAPAAGIKLHVLTTGANKGIRSESPANTDFVYIGFKTGDVAPQFSVAIGASGPTVTLDDGTGASSVKLARVAGPQLFVDKTIRVSGNVREEDDLPMIVETVRVAAGAGDTLTVRASNGVAGAGANAGGVATFRSGNSTAVAGASAGADVVVQGGDAAATVGVVNGGKVRLVTGTGAGIGGVSGTVVATDSGGTAADYLPPVDASGRMGNGSLRYLSMRAVTITSGDLAFDDPSCPNCERAFKKGDQIVLGVHKTAKDEEGRRIAYTIPMHRSCRRKAA